MLSRLRHTTMRSTKAVVAALLTVALLTAACGDDYSAVDPDSDDAPDGTGVEMPDRAPDLVGTITVVTRFEPITDDCVPADEADPDGTTSNEDPPICTPEDDDVVGSVLVEGDLRPERGRKISYTVTTDTKITGSADGEGVGVFADLAEGQVAETWATGPCAESYPEQCRLEAIRVTG
jgi:hypothetical protein